MSPLTRTKNLLNNNISEDDVNSLTDNDLLALLSALNESGLNEGNSEELTAEEVREFLLNQPGANIAEINSLSAEELLEIKDKLIKE